MGAGEKMEDSKDGEQTFSCLLALPVKTFTAIALYLGPGTFHLSLILISLQEPESSPGDVQVPAPVSADSVWHMQQPSSNLPFFLQLKRKG